MPRDSSFLEYPNETQKISVYTDADNLHEVFAQVLEEVRKYKSIMGIGRVEFTAV